MKIIIFGAGAAGKKFYQYEKNKNTYQIVAFLDNFKGNLSESIDGIPILAPEKVINTEYDKIFITINDINSINDVKKQLNSYGIKDETIEIIDPWWHFWDEWLYDENKDPRVLWLKNFSQYINDMNIQGNVAECGVHQGHYSYYINKYFCDRKLYLFDTFCGFDVSDVEYEINLADENFINGSFAKICFSGNDEKKVLEHMPNSELCIIKKGYFPDTAKDVNDKFCFVNLDMDLYKPMLAALSFFWDKIVPGGVLLLHDYFHPELPGVKKAVEDFESQLEVLLPKIPIGDFCSIAIIKYH